LYDVCWWVRRWWWSVKGYRPRHWLLGAHPLLKCPVETKEFSTLYEEVRGSSYSVLVEVRMCWASAIKLSSADSCGCRRRHSLLGFESRLVLLLLLPW
jgi:hypothetical protein